MHMSKEVNPFLSREVSGLIKCLCILCEHLKNHLGFYYESLYVVHKYILIF